MNSSNMILQYIICLDGKAINLFYMNIKLNGLILIAMWSKVYVIMECLLTRIIHSHLSV